MAEPSVFGAGGEFGPAVEVVEQPGRPVRPELSYDGPPRYAGAARRAHQAREQEAGAPITASASGEEGCVLEPADPVTDADLERLEDELQRLMGVRLALRLRRSA